MASTKKAPGKALRWVIAGFAAPALVAVFLFDPRSSDFFPPCIFKAGTGQECPGCGATRVLHDLLHLDFARAVSTNVLVVASIPPMLMLLWHRWRKGVWLPRQPRRIETTVLVGIVACFGILRNVPIDPFQALAAG
jgi:hypothetical protein